MTSADAMLKAGHRADELLEYLVVVVDGALEQMCLVVLEFVL